MRETIFYEGPQKVPIEVVISGSKATFSRKVWNQDNSTVVGTEEGVGGVGTTGAINLSSEWKSAVANPQYRFTAAYVGDLTSNAGSLRGTQVWTFEEKTENRLCSILLQR